MTYAIPPEQLPPEESNFMTNNDYGYGNFGTEDEEGKSDGNPLVQLGQRTEASYREYVELSKNLDKATEQYNVAAASLREMRDRYQKAFFAMNGNLAELNEWINSNLTKSLSVDLTMSDNIPQPAPKRYLD